MNYAEITGLVTATPALDPRLHDFFALLTGGESFAPAASGPGDTLLCTAGPWAHLYHYWREVSGGRYRIIRDARTTAWSPYLAQEWLAGPLVRPGDLIIFPSGFARAFYQQLFPHITAENSCVLYPLAEHLPPPLPRVPGEQLRVGYLGRLADDKNVRAVLDLGRALGAHRDVELHFAGPFYPPGGSIASPGALLAVARAVGMPPGRVHYHGNVPYPRIGTFFARLDVLYFPAVSSNESFGRVLAEAGSAGLPVVATDYAASPELMPAANLVPVRYGTVQDQRLTYPFSFGVPDTSAAAAAILAGPRALDRSREARYAPATFLQLFSAGRVAAEPFAPSAGVHAFLSGLQVTGLAPLSASESRERCAAQLGLMRSLLHPRASARLGAALRLLRYLPGDPMLQFVVRQRLLARNAPAVLRNAVAPARYVGFDPRASLAVTPGAGHACRA
jgi:glycosyltransferase involved in cell wall biosynthesis